MVRGSPSRAGRRNDAVRIADLLTGAGRLEAILAAGPARFAKDPLLQDAALRRLEIVGEGAGHMSSEFRNRHPEIPWRAMRGFASLVKHEYWRVDLHLVWRAVEAMPAIRRSLANSLKPDARGAKRPVD